MEETEKSVGKVVPRTQHIGGVNYRSDSRMMSHEQVYEIVGERVCTRRSAQLTNDERKSPMRIAQVAPLFESIPPKL
ncbi:MAG: hypothetical protein ABI988_03500, partial [Nitrospirota bacterium]